MSTPYGLNLPGSYAVDATITGLTVTAGSISPASAQYTNGGAAGSQISGQEFSVAVGYGSTISGGPAVIYVAHEVSTGVYEVTAVAWSFAHIATPQASTTLTRNFQWKKPGNFVVYVGNPSGNSSLTGVTLRNRPITRSFGS
ncbi:MAG: hypothetical protein P4L84_11115 [Isosphaeraceae bacterium]|nr:hypothetical protein [Isosphaeraceae bacterium]